MFRINWLILNFEYTLLTSVFIHGCLTCAGNVPEPTVSGSSQCTIKIKEYEVIPNFSKSSRKGTQNGKALQFCT